MEHDGVDEAVGGDACGEILRQFRRSQAPEHRHLCAIAIAISEILEEQSLAPSPTACFAAAMSALERLINTSPRDLAVTTALITFLARVIDRVPPAVLRSKSEKTLQLLLQVLNVDASVSATVKPGLNCVKTVVTGCDLSNWGLIAKPFHVVLKHCVDQKPKVRKCAHKCVAQMLMAFQRHPAFAPASDAVVSSFESTLKSVVGTGQTQERMKVAQGTGAVEVLHMLGALTTLLPVMSGKAIGRILPILADLIQLRQRLLTRRILDTVQELCTSATSEVPVNEFADALGTLASYFSIAGKKDVDEVPVATRLIQKGFERLHNVDRSACASKLPSVFASVAGLLAAEQEEIVYGAADCMRNLVLSCVDESLVQQGIRQLQQSQELRGPPSALERVCATAESLLGYQYSTAWDMALPVVSALFDVLGPASYQLMSGTVKTLGDLQRLPDQDMTCRKQLHKTLGAAVAAMGPEQFLKLLPLAMDNDDLATSRIWLLPILKQYIVGARLGFFADDLLPLASRLRAREQKLIAHGKPVSAKNCEVCVESVWALLPSVCNYPVDTATDFGRIAKTLGDALNKEAGLRGLICSALQTLILQNRMARGDQLEGKELKTMEEFSSLESNSVSDARARVRDCYTPDAASASLSAIAGYSRNFLPLLFNLFLAQPSEKRGDLQATIASIASISDQQTVKNFFIAIMKKLLQATKESGKPKDKQDPMQVDSGNVEETATSRRCVFMDLALSLVKGLDEETLTMLYETAVPALQDKEGLVQKKSYKVMSSICKENQDFLSKKSEDMLGTLLKSLEVCHASARRHRLECVHYIVIHYTKFGDQKRDQIIATLISEIILATKEANKKTRNGAYDLLIAVGHAMNDLNNDKSNLMRYFNMILGCLAGTTPHMISAALASLARLIYEFSSDLCHTIPQLLPSALLLLRSKNREIIKSVLGLVKVVIARLPAAELEPHLQGMVLGLMLWSDDSKNRFKAKVREIIERLVRRCGMSSVEKVMPPEHLKLLTSIRKKKEQAERKKRGTVEEDDDAKSLKSRATTARRSAWNHTDLFSDDGDDDSEDDYESTRAPTMTKSAAVSKTSNASRSKKLRKSNKRLPEDLMDTGNEPLDLLDVQRTREVLSSVSRRRKGGDDEEDEPHFTADGRLIVDEKVDKTRKRSRNDSDEEYDTKSQGGKSFGFRSDASTAMASTKHGRSVKDSQGRKRAKNSWAYTGEDYVNRKGKGDMKKEGKLDPYAYWPLDPKMLNRRQAKRAAARDGMVSVFKVGPKQKGGNASKPSLVKRGGNKAHKGSKSKAR